MNRTSEFFVLGPSADILTDIGNQAVNREMSLLVPQLTTPRSAQEVTQYSGDVVRRSLWIDSIYRSRDSHQSNLREIFRCVAR